MSHARPVIHSLHCRSDGMVFQVMEIVELPAGGTPLQDAYEVRFASEQELKQGRPGTMYPQSAFWAEYENAGFCACYGDDTP